MITNVINFKFLIQWHVFPFLLMVCQGLAIKWLKIKILNLNTVDLPLQKNYRVKRKGAFHGDLGFGSQTGWDLSLSLCCLISNRSEKKTTLPLFYLPQNGSEASTHSCVMRIGAKHFPPRSALHRTCTVKITVTTIKALGSLWRLLEFTMILKLNPSGKDDIWVSKITPSHSHAITELSQKIIGSTHPIFQNNLGLLKS